MRGEAGAGPGQFGRPGGRGLRGAVTVPAVIVVRARGQTHSRRAAEAVVSQFLNRLHSQFLIPQ